MDTKNYLAKQVLILMINSMSEQGTNCWRWHTLSLERQDSVSCSSEFNL